MRRHPRAHFLAVTIFLLVAALVVSAPGATAKTTTTVQKYIVLYKENALPSNTSAAIQNAGGSVVALYPQIGVAIAKSNNGSFRASVLQDDQIAGAAATTNFATRVDDGTSEASSDAQGPPPGDLPNSTATDADNLSSLQWDMRQIHTPEAHEVTGGSPMVLVGDIDTGIDFSHPDLAPNISVANSANCVTGSPVAGTAAQDDNGHGTHTAGTIAAASNGQGIVGVAPNVKIAGIKAGNADGFFFPEAVVCSFMWAATHGVDVTNNSYFADPWLFNCKNDPEQRAIWMAEQRAIQFAQQSGVTVVASEGNQSEDISHPTRDQTSPDDTTPVDRTVTNACVVIPVEIPGVIGVTADGANTQTDGDNDPNDYLKSYYSSFGISTADVVAPGGDRRFGINAAAGALNGRVLSTYPASLAGTCPASLSVTDGAGFYCYLQGTSMAGPHVAGVAALVVSRYGSLAGPGNATMQPGKVSSIVQGTADKQPCPTSLPTTNPVDGRSYLSFVGVDDEQVQTCEGTPDQNSWYGRGQVNALKAIGG